MTADGAAPETAEASGPVDPALARLAMRVAVYRRAALAADQDYKAVQAAAQVTFADIRRRGIPSHEVRLPSGQKVALITIEKGAEVPAWDEDELLGVIVTNEPGAFETYVDPAALTDPKVMAFMAAHFPDHVRSRPRPDVIARYRKEALENGGSVWLRAGSQAGQQVRVAAIGHLPASGKYSVLWADGGKGMIQLGEALDAGLIELDGSVAGEPGPVAAERRTEADLPEPEPQTLAVPAPDDDSAFFDSEGRFLSPELAAIHAVTVQGGFSTPAREARRMLRDPAHADMGREWLTSRGLPLDGDAEPEPGSPAPASDHSTSAALERAMRRGQPRRVKGPQHPPTDEQQAVLDAVKTGDGVVISAGAGTGKTSSLMMIGDQEADRQGLYVAFNAAIVADAKPRFGSGVRVSTAHALAMAAVGKDYRHRLNGPRVPANQVARILRINEPLRVAEDKVLAPAQQARLVMETVERFCRSADPELTTAHVPHKPGLDTPDILAVLRSALMPWARRAWADLTGTEGELKFGHDCQPSGTLVRVVRRIGGNNSHTAEGWPTEWADIAIEQVRVGDRVVTWNNMAAGEARRLGSIRKTGRRVTKAGQRPYDGRLITVRTPGGQASSYTPEHICLVRIGTGMRGKWVAYMMRKDGHYRVGRVQWAYGSQNQTLGISSRARSQGPDAVWILSVHDTDGEAALAEAMVQHQFNIPGWQFVSPNERMPLDAFWLKVGDNSTNAEACLTAHGRDIRYPLWEPGKDANPRWNQRPLAMRACNLMESMLVCEADGAQVDHARNFHSTGGWSEAWQPISLSDSWYTGTVYSLEVDEDHTYVADGIVTHNCYLKIWGLSGPQLSADYVLYDEAQDADAVVQDVILGQRNTQLIAVGDKSQSLYEWRGAINAMDGFPAKHRLTLSRSFRFGPAISHEANKWLEILNADLRLTGSDRVSSAIRPLDAADAVLCRTNAGVIAEAMKSIEAGSATAIVGGGKDIRALAEAAIALKQGKGTSHPELYAFRTWGEVQDHAENDPSGSDLRVLVNLIDANGPERIIEVIDSLTDEKHAQAVISTAHRGKGREWDSVRIASDFHPPKGSEDDPDGGQVSPPDARLAYVAVTWAKLSLDRTGLAWVDRYLPAGA